MSRCGALILALLFTTAAQEPEAVRKLETARRLKQQDARAAIAAYESALGALRQSRDRKLAGQALLEAGQTALAAERYDRAAAWGAEAADVFRLLGDAANEAQANHVAGSASVYLGDYGRALERFQRALELDRERHDALGEINRLGNIATVSFYQGKYLDSLDAYEEALRRVDQTTGEPWNAGRRQLLLTNLAVLYEQLGQNEKALGYYQQVRAMGSAIKPNEQGQVLANLGTLYRRLGDAVKALEMYEAADRLFDQDHLSDAEIHVLQNVGIAQALDFRNFARAMEAFGKALGLAEKTSNRREMSLAHLFRAETLYRMGRPEEAKLDYAEALTGAREIGARDEEWQALYGMGRLERSAGDPARALGTFRQAIGVIESVRSQMSSGLRAEFLANKRQVYDAAIELMLRDPAPSTLLPMFEQARSRNLQDALGGARGALTLEKLKQALPAGSLLIDYWMGPDGVAAVWVTRDAAGVVARNAAGDDGLDVVKGLAKLAGDARDNTWRTAAERAGRVLLERLPLDGMTQVLIVPDGVLQSVPFELLARRPGGPLLVETAAVSYLPAVAMLLEARPRQTRAWPWERQLVGFGDPVVDGRAGLAGDERWQRLPESRRELKSIASALRGTTRLHLGDGNQKRYLLGDVRSGAPLLHFSTHAEVDFTDPDRSRILFTPEPGRRGSEYLFRKEAQLLPLAGVDLVTLSACDTESGKMTAGEGTQSFSRAFLAAGARSTVTTLWRVADGPTADFMERFYERLARGDSKAEALRAAKLGFLRSGSDLALPRFWAAFVLNGDGQTPIRPVLSWMWLLGPVLAAAIAVGAIRLRAARSARRSAAAR